MEIPLQITIRDLPYSKAMEMNIRKKVNKLHLYNNRIMSCRIVVDIVQKHQHQGKEYSAKIDLKIPGAELVANKHRHQDAYIAIRDSFNALQKQLKNRNRKQHGMVKTHETILTGKVVRLFNAYGFIENTEGNGKEYYFNSNHVLNNAFKTLTLGTPVFFCEAANAGDSLQANHVIVRH